MEGARGERISPQGSLKCILRGCLHWYYSVNKSITVINSLPHECKLVESELLLSVSKTFDMTVSSLVFNNEMISET